MKKLNENNLSHLLENIATEIKSRFDAVTPQVATENNLGIVKPDNTTITINNSGVISLLSATPSLATNSTNGILKPDGTTIGIKQKTGESQADSLYIINEFDDPEEDTDSWFPKPEPEPEPDPTPTPDPEPNPEPDVTLESNLPYVVGIVGRKLICLDKATNSVGSDGFSTWSGDIRLVGMQTSIVSNEISNVSISNESSGRLVSHSDFEMTKTNAFTNKQNMTNTLSNQGLKIYDMSYTGYFYSNGAGFGGGNPPTGFQYASGNLYYVDNSNYSTRAGYVSATGGYPDRLVYDNQGNEYCFSKSGGNNYSIFKRGMYSVTPYSDSDLWNTYTLSDISGFLFIYNDVIHEFTSNAHYTRSNGNKTPVNDTANSSSSYTIYKLKSDIDYDGSLYGILEVNNTYGIYKYNFSGQSWTLLRELPEQQMNSSDTFDFYVDASSPAVAYFVHKQTSNQKIVLYANGLDGNSTTWTKVGQCIPELWKATE